MKSRDKEYVSDCLGLAGDREQRWEMRVTANAYRVSFWGDGNILEPDRGGGCTTLQRYYTPLNGLLLLG